MGSFFRPLALLDIRPLHFGRLSVYAVRNKKGQIEIFNLTFFCAVKLNQVQLDVSCYNLWISDLSKNKSGSKTIPKYQSEALLPMYQFENLKCSNAIK